MLVKDGAGSLLMIGRKLLFHIHLVGFAVAFLDVFLESKKYEKIGKTMDIKISQLEKELKGQMFGMRLTDIKTKFIAIKNAFKLVLEGEDPFEVWRSRLDSIYLICEEV